jgi:type II pantothenate kinase
MPDAALPHAVAIDFGASNTDVVYRSNGSLRRWNLPSRGQPDDTRVREVLAHGLLSPADVEWIAVTGGNREHLSGHLDGRPVRRVDEVQAIGRGGLALAGVEHAVVSSAGSGNAVVLAGPDGSRHVTGSGVGGGTLVGLGRLLINVADPNVLDSLAREGTSTSVNLTIGEILGGAIGSLPPDTTAVNFGRVARGPVEVSPEDMAAALVNMVGQVVAIIAINAARATGVEHIIVVGHLTDLPSVRHTLHLVGKFYGATLTIPEGGGYATATGALLVADGMV